MNFLGKKFENGFYNYPEYLDNISYMFIKGNGCNNIDFIVRWCMVVDTYDDIRKTKI